MVNCVMYRLSYDLNMAKPWNELSYFSLGYQFHSSIKCVSYVNCR